MINVNFRIEIPSSARVILSHRPNVQQATCRIETFARNRTMVREYLRSNLVFSTAQAKRPGGANLSPRQGVRLFNTSTF